MGIIQDLREDMAQRRGAWRETRKAEAEARQALVRVAETAGTTLVDMLKDVKGYTQVTAAMTTYEPTAAELKYLRAATIALWYNSPVAAQRAWLTKCGALGKGIERPAAADEAVQEVIDRFWDDRDNQVCLTSHEALSLTNLLLLLEGERFLTLHTSPGESVVKLGDIPPNEITAIITHPQNRRQPVLYKREFVKREWDFDRGGWAQEGAVVTWYYLDRRYSPDRLEPESDPEVMDLLARTPNLQEDVSILQVKADSLGLRGFPELARMVPWAKQHAAALSDLATIVKALAAFAWKKKVTTKSADAIRAAAEMFRTPPPGAGGLQVENQNVNLEAMNVATGHTGNQTATAREMFLQAIRDGGYGEHWYGDATNGNLATASAMELPAIWRIEERQKLFESVMLELCEIAVERALLLGDFPATRIAPDADLSIDVDFPQAQPMTEINKTNLVTSVIMAQQAGLLPPREASYQVMQLLNCNNISEMLETMYAEEPGLGMVAMRPFPVTAAEAVPASALPVTRTLEEEFAAALDKRVFEPWHRQLVSWLRRQGTRIPTLAEVDIALGSELALAPDSKALSAVLEKYSVAAGELGGQQAVGKMLRALGGRWPVAEAEPEQKKDSRFQFNLRDPKLLARLQLRGEKITGEVTQTMKDDLRGVLSREFYKNGKGPLALAEEIETIFPATYARRGETIARTETLFAQTLVQNETYKQNGVEKKQWLALLDKNTRDDHAAMQGQTVPMDEPFQVPSGGTIDYPGAPDGETDQVVNCRCDFLPVFGKEMTLPPQPWLGG